MRQKFGRPEAKSLLVFGCQSSNASTHGFGNLDPLGDVKGGRRGKLLSVEGSRVGVDGKMYEHFQFKGDGVDLLRARQGDFNLVKTVSSNKSYSTYSTNLLVKFSLR